MSRRCNLWGLAQDGALLRRILKCGRPSASTRSSSRVSAHSRPGCGQLTAGRCARGGRRQTGASVALALARNVDAAGARFPFSPRCHSSVRCKGDNVIVRHAVLLLTGFASRRPSISHYRSSIVDQVDDYLLLGHDEAEENKDDVSSARSTNVF